MSCCFCGCNERNKLVFCPKYNVLICNGMSNDAGFTHLAYFIRKFPNCGDLHLPWGRIECSWCREETNLHALRIVEIQGTIYLQCCECFLRSGSGKVLRDQCKSWTPLVANNQVSRALVKGPSRQINATRAQMNSIVKSLKPRDQKGAIPRLAPLPIECESYVTRFSMLYNFVSEEERHSKMMSVKNVITVTDAKWNRGWHFTFKNRRCSRTLTLGNRLRVTPNSGREHSAHVSDISGNTITVSLDECCSNCSKRVKIMIMFTDIPYKRQKVALDRAMALGDDMDFFFRPFAGMIGHINEKMARKAPNIQWHRGILTQLDDSQLNVVRYAMNHKFAVVQGPPGCGKSTCIACQALTMATQTSHRISIVTRDNSAADNIACIIMNQLAATPRRISVLRVVGEMYFECVPDELLPICSHYTPGNPVPMNRTTASETQERRRIERAHIIISTACMTGSSLIDKVFPATAIIVDEANTLVDPELLIPLTTFARTLDQVSLYGDQNQIGPFTGSPRTLVCGYGISLLQRIAWIGNPMVIYPRFWQPVNYQMQMLSVQYRMHPMLADFPNQVFYQGRVLSGVDTADRRERIRAPKWPNRNIPRIFYNVENSCEQRTPDGKSIFNMPETCCLAELLDKLYNSGIASGRIGIITFYSGQVDLIIEVISALCNAPTEWIEGVEVNTVDAYEGRDIDYAILVCVRANTGQSEHAIGFLANTGRMNVALTRSRYGLYVIGHENTLRTEAHWENFIIYCRKTQTFVTWR